MKLILPFYFVLAFSTCLAQTGNNGFGVLSLPSSARASALGGDPIALAERDLSLVGENPALLDSVELQDIYLQYSPFFGGINLLNAGYAFNTKAIGPMAISLSYLNYGSFNRTDNIGTNLGSFSPQDYVAQLSKSHRLGLFVLGANLKFIHTSIDGFGASAIASDLGGTFQVPNKDFTVGLVIKNLGFVIDDYVGSEVDLPTDIQIGTSFKPKYMPARFNINFSMLGNDLGYFHQNPNDDENASNIDSFFRHLSAGVELYIGKAFTAMVGYDHLRNQELRLVQGNYGAGFSFGFNIKIKKFDFTFSRATYHAAGGMNTLGISTNLSQYKKIF